MNQPHYLVLLDENTKLQKDKFKGYFYQSDLEHLSEVKIVNHLIPAYFDSYREGHYVSGQFLRTVYPHDD